MAGEGKRFVERGFTTPKPLILLDDIPMFSVVLCNLDSVFVKQITLVTQAKWNLNKYISKFPKKIRDKIQLIEIDYLTLGPAESVLLAEGKSSLDEIVVIANSDQYIDCDVDEFYLKLQHDSQISGSIITMKDTSPKWSYVTTDEHGFIDMVKEKQVISDIATVGIYGFKKAKDCFESIKEMRDNLDYVNNELYVAPSFNYLIKKGQKIMEHNLGSVATIMHGMGIPEDLEKFQDSIVYKKVIQQTKRWLEIEKN